MTTTQLIKVLETYPPDADVVALWDSGWSKLSEHSLQEDSNGRAVVEFDVSEYGTHEE